MIYFVGGTRQAIVVPAGFVTDYASIPQALWSIYSPHDQYSRAAVVHDYLYWDQQCTRAQADKLFLIAMKESGVSPLTQEAVFEGVSQFGAESWQSNQQQRQSGLPRVVPTTRKDFPPNWSWEMYRGLLVSDGVRDPAFPIADYCNLGNSADVPGLNVEAAAIVNAARGVVRPARGLDVETLRYRPR